MDVEQLRDTVLAALDDVKAKDVVVLPVIGICDFTDYMVVATGTSSRHVGAAVDRVIEFAKAAGERPLGSEGAESRDWVLLDLGDVVVHVMQESAREFYDLERLWGELPEPGQEAQPES